MHIVIALLLSVAVIYALAIWVIASAATFMLINLVSLRTARKNADSALSEEPVGAELENIPAFR